MGVTSRAREPGKPQFGRSLTLPRASLFASRIVNGCAYRDQFDDRIYGVTLSWEAKRETPFGRRLTLPRTPTLLHWSLEPNRFK
jgi:hypothetical protein